MLKHWMIGLSVLAGLSAIPAVGTAQIIAPPPLEFEVPQLERLRTPTINWGPCTLPDGTQARAFYADGICTVNVGEYSEHYYDESAVRCMEIFEEICRGTARE